METIYKEGTRIGSAIDNSRQLSDEHRAIAKQIAALANGLTPKQFLEIIDEVLENISYYAVLSIQPAPVLNEGN